MPNRFWVLMLCLVVLTGCRGEVATSLAPGVDEVPASAERVTLSLSGWT